MKNHLQEKLKNRHWQYFLAVLSPVHVGSGVKLRKGLDFFCAKEAKTQKERVWRIDPNWVEKLGNDRDKAGAFAEYVMTTNAPQVEQWAAANGIGYNTLLAKDSAGNFINYPSEMTSNQLFDFVRTGIGEPIIPGSSLKGALATVLLWELNHDLRSEKKREELLQEILAKDKPTTAGEPLLKRTFFLSGNEHNESKDASHRDVKRLLRVNDVAFRNQDLICAIVQIRNVSNSNTGQWKPNDRNPLQLAVEALRPYACAPVTITIDDFLLHSQRVQSEIKFEQHRAVFNREQFAEIANRYAERQIQRQLQFFSNYGPQTMVDFYQALLTKVRQLLEAPNNVDFILRLSWGSGWQGMTGELFEEPNDMARLRNKPEFKLRRARFAGLPQTCPNCSAPNPDIDRKKPKSGFCHQCKKSFDAPQLRLEPIFPKTRKVVMAGVAGTPSALGWVMLCHDRPKCPSEFEPEVRQHLVPVAVKPTAPIKQAAPPPPPPPAPAVKKINKGEKLRAEVITAEGKTFRVRLLEKDVGRELGFTHYAPIGVGNIIEVTVQKTNAPGDQVTQIGFSKKIK